MNKKARAGKQKINVGFNANQRDILLSALICISAILGAFYWVVYIEQPKALAQRISAVTATSADHQTLILRNVIKQLSERVSSQASRNDLKDAVLTGQHASTNDFEKGLKNAFPEATSTQLIFIAEQGVADEKSETDRLRNHIEIDLLRKTITSKTLEIEAYRYQDQWLISFSQLVSPRLAIFVSFPASYFQGLLTSLAGEALNHQLVQTYKNRRDVIIAAANTANQQYMASRALPVPGWTLEVIPQAAMIRSLESEGIFLWLACLLCVALIAASHAVFFLRSSAMRRATAATKPTPPAAKDTTPTTSAAPETTARQNPKPRPTDQNTVKTDSPPLPQHNDPQQLALNAFRAYDIRGEADRDLDDYSCKLIGQAIGSEALARGESKILLGRDGRLSSPRIREALLTGLQSTGINVIDLGLLATPMLQYACRELNVGNGVMITGSHNPGHHNGMKIYMQFNTLAADDIQALRRRIEAQDFCQGEGKLDQDSIQQRYINRITSDVVIARPLNIVIDAGNGATSTTAPELFEELGCHVSTLFCEVDGNFPNHPPDPTIPENLAALKEAVLANNADIGLAFDGDGDRVAVVTAEGQCPAADELLLVLAEDMVSRNPGGQILFDIKCSRTLQKRIIDRGGRPLMWKSGHAYMKQKMVETGALLGGEFSGHIFFNERWYGFDDGMYAAARLLEALTLADTSMDKALASQEKMFATEEILIAVADDKKFQLVDAFKEAHNFDDASLTDIDGLRADFRNGWGLIRASNTGPAITLRFEADSEVGLQGIRERFSKLLTKIDPQLADSL